MANLESALGEVIEINREEALKDAGDGFEEIAITG